MDTTQISKGTIEKFSALSAGNFCHSNAIPSRASAPVGLPFQLLFLARDAMRKRGTCCRPVSVRHIRV